MSRDDIDIPEVFRRAMEEWGNDGGGGDDDGDKRQPLPNQPNQDKRTNRLLVLAGVILVFLFSFNWIINTYTEWLWFNAIEYVDVWLKQWSFQVITFITALLIAFLLFFINWHIARRRALKNTPPFNPNFLKLSGVKWLINGVAFFFAFGFAGAIGAQWPRYLRYIYRVPYGLDDPIFGQDIAFYMFELPVYEGIQQWLLALLVLVLIGVIVIYAVNHSPELQRGTWRPHESKIFRQHVALLGALILLLWAAGYIFEIFNLMYSPRGVVFGASYTDMNASIYAYIVQMVLMLLAAVMLLINVFRLTIRPLLITAALWLVATIIIGGIIPSLIQRYSVEPNEVARETPYISNNIKYTREAFGLESIEALPYEIGNPLTAEDILENTEFFKNIRLWDYRPLQSTYTELQELRPYYQFGQVDIDRYEIDGETRQIMLGTRELEKSQLPNQSWVNRNLEFTHGYGIVMNPVDEFTEDGQPVFFVKDLPPQTEIDVLKVTRPEIYYGELSNDPVFVASARDEFSYPGDGGNIYSRYEGTGGVILDNVFKRLAFAFRLGNSNILLSNDINNQTRIQFHRQIQERIHKVTPFLALDGDPYNVIWNGRLMWMQDAYTISRAFPYATPINTSFGYVNYIRNSVKIVVDAYNGDVTYYITDPEDPLIRSYARAFPNLFKSFAEMPEGLQAHVRYPTDLFEIQTQQYLRYHMTDERVFYNQEDVWAIPKELFEGDQIDMEPYYVNMPLPGSNTSEYLLIQPYTPNGKTNMIAWLAARNDPENYGELIVYELPKQELVFGPSQIESRIDQEPSISQQFSLWNQEGSRIIRGNLLVLPINHNFLYVEPVYLASETSALPELKRVIVASNTRIAMEETLAEAIISVFANGNIVPEVEVNAPIENETGEETTPPSTEIPEGGELSPEVEALIQSANAHYLAAEAAQRDGDWATYGEELDALQADLAKLLELTTNP